MDWNIAFEVAGVILTVLCIVLAVYDLPGLLSLVGLKRAGNWLEQRTPSIPLLDRLSGRRTSSR